MIELIALATAILGCLFLLPLFVLSMQRPANVWLGFFVYAIVSLALADYCLMTNVYQRYPLLWGLFDWPVAGIGAFFYCYVRSLLGLSNGWRQVCHFIPVIVFGGLLLQVRFTLSEADFIAMVQARVLEQREPAQDWQPILLMFQLLACGYALAVLYRLRQYRVRLRHYYSSTQHRDLVWLQWLTCAVVLLLVLWFPAVQAGGPWLIALAVGRIGTLYAFGWYGFRQQQVFLPAPQLVSSIHTALQMSATKPNNEAEPVEHGLTPEAVTTDTVPAQSSPFTTPSPAPDIIIPVQEAAEFNRYARSGMTLAVQQLIGDRLERRMIAAQDYLQNDLNLTELAQRIGTSTQLLSEYLNVVLQQNFFDYINSLRVAEVQRQLKAADATKTNTTLLSLAFAAGFNSKSTFNTAFRKHTGMTPSAWRAQYCQNNADHITAG